MRYERGVHGGELRRQLVIVAESGSEAWRVAGAEARQRTVACVCGSPTPHQPLVGGW